MNDLERIRAYIESTLGEGERAAFEERLAHDPELRELVETYGLVARATGGPVPAADSRFEDVTRRLGARRLRRTLLVAAALLVALGAGLWHGLRPPGPVTLAALSLDVVPDPEAPPPWPRALLHHTTAGERGLVFYDDLDEARDVARAAGRPVFLFVDYDGCPLCDQFRQEHARDGAVVAAADAFVLANVGWQEAPEEFRTNPRDGWPIYVVLDAEGRREDGYLGMKTPAALAAWLGRVAGDLRAGGKYAFHDWEGLLADARRLAEAEEREPAAALPLLRAAKAGPLGAAARAGIAVLEAEARRALFAARDAEPAEARALLEEAAARFRGTPWGDDLARVARHLAKHGAFPILRRG